MKDFNSSTGPSRGLWTVLFIIMALTLLAGGYWYYRTETGRIRQAKYEELSAIGKLKSGQIEQWRKERIGDVERSARSPLFKNALAQFLLAPDTPGLRADLTERLKLEQAVFGYANALLLDLQGNILISAQDRPDPVDPQRLDLARYRELTLRAAETIFQPLGLEPTVLRQVIDGGAVALPLGKKFEPGRRPQLMEGLS